MEISVTCFGYMYVNFSDPMYRLELFYFSIWKIRNLMILWSITDFVLCIWSYCDRLSCAAFT